MHFERETMANKLFLKKHYFRTEMSEGASIDMHLKEMKELADKLSSIGAPISKADQVSLFSEVCLHQSLQTDFVEAWIPTEWWTCDEVGHIQPFLSKVEREVTAPSKVTKDEIESDSDREGAFPLSNEVPEDKWLVDSGTSSHMTEYLTTYRSLEGWSWLW